jgi:ATP-dependent Clp protease ATP-binding subunit ClpC
MQNSEKEYLKNYDFKNAISDDDNDDDEFGPRKPNKSTNTNSKTPILDSFSRDLTRMAEENKIDPIVGRENEIERVSQILSRRKKNNPILIGEPGCVDGETLITVRKISDLGNHDIVSK